MNKDQDAVLERTKESMASKRAREISSRLRQAAADFRMAASTRTKAQAGYEQPVLKEAPDIGEARSERSTTRQLNLQLPNARLDDSVDDVALRKKRRLTLSFLVMVVLPTLLAAFYYMVWVTPRYMATAVFAMKTPETQALDIVGMLTGMGGKSDPTQDPAVIQTYVLSRAMIEQLDTRVGLRKLYSNHEIDWFSRLPSDAPIEDFVKYWANRIAVNVSISSNIVEIDVQAFTPQDAKRIADTVVTLCEQLVNTMSLESKRDAIRFAQDELKTAETRVKNALSQRRAFQERYAALDPGKDAVGTLDLLQKLYGQRADLQQQLDSISPSLLPSAPSIVALRAQVSAINGQIDQIKASIENRGGANGMSIAQQLQTFENLTLEIKFAEQSYSLALAALEKARTDAEKKDTYLATFVPAGLPEYAELPHRALDTLFIFLGALAVWGITLLVSAGVKDHAI